MPLIDTKHSAEAGSPLWSSTSQTLSSISPGYLHGMQEMPSACHYQTALPKEKRVVCYPQVDMQEHPAIPTLMQAQACRSHLTEACTAAPC